MRIARKDEGIDAERCVFFYACNDCWRVADERSTGAASHEANARPKVGADFELVAPTTMERRHAALSNGVHACKDRLRFGNCLVVEMPDEVIGGLPGFDIGFTHDDMKADSERQLASHAGCDPAHALDFLFNL